jgi:hypothetical protein
VCHNADNVVQFSVITGVESARDRFFANARNPDLSLGIVGFGVVNIEGDLAVNTDGLNLLHDYRL